MKNAAVSITEVIQRKVKVFTKEKFFDIYEDILRDEIGFVTNNGNGEGYNSSEDALIKKVKDYENKKMMKNKNIWKLIATFMFRSDVKYKCRSVMVISYLKQKVKMVVKKIFYISVKYKHSIEFILRKYLDICRYEMKKIKAVRINNLKLLKKRNSFVGIHTNKNDNKSPKGSIRATSGDNRKSSKYFQLGNQVNNQLLNEDIEEEGEEEEEENPLNLFIGNFNIKSFKEHNQTVYLKKYNNITTFIFVNKEDPNNPNLKNNPHSRTIISKRGGKKHAVSMPKIYGKSGVMNIHRFDTFGFIDSDIQDNERLFTRNFRKKHNNICKTTGNNINSNYNSTLPTKKSAIKGKRLSIRVGCSPEIVYTGLTNNNHCDGVGSKVDLKKDNLNLFKRKSKIARNNSKHLRLKSPRSMFSHELSSNKSGMSLLLSSPTSKKSVINDKSKTRNKVKLINFFTKTDLYY